MDLVQSDIESLNEHAAYRLHMELVDEAMHYNELAFRVYSHIRRISRPEIEAVEEYVPKPKPIRKKSREDLMAEKVARALDRLGMSTEDLSSLLNDGD